MGECPGPDQCLNPICANGKFCSFMLTNFNPKHSMGYKIKSRGFQDRAYKKRKSLREQNQRSKHQSKK